MELCLQLGWASMKLPILYTMSWPGRVECSEQTWPRLDLVKLGSLTFKEPDHVKYPAMNVAYAAGRCAWQLLGGNASCRPAAATQEWENVRKAHSLNACVRAFIG